MLTTRRFPPPWSVEPRADCGTPRPTKDYVVWGRGVFMRLALAVRALTAAAAPPFSDIALARAASASAIKLSIVTCLFAAAAAVAC